MKVAIAGAHGQIAQVLVGLLAARGDEVIGLIRNPDHADAIAALGATPVVCDLESAHVDEVTPTLRGVDAVVFAAGSGPGQPAERKLSMDRDGALRLLDAAVRASVLRYIMVSAVGAESPPDDDAVFSVYLRAKAEADDAVMMSNREWAVLRPGRLTDDPPTGTVRLDAEPVRGEVSRADVAAVIAAVLADRDARELLVYVNGGDTPIADALAAALA